MEKRKEKQKEKSFMRRVDWCVVTVSLSRGIGLSSSSLTLRYWILRNSN